MSEIYCGALQSWLDRLNLFDGCWADDEYCPDRFPDVSDTLKCFAATYWCLIYLNTNGLLGLLEGSVGHAVPEFQRFVSHLGCDDSSCLLSQAVDLVFPDGFVRNAERRMRIVQPFFDEAHDEHIDSLENALYSSLEDENLEVRLESFAKIYCDKMGISVQ